MFNCKYLGKVGNTVKRLETILLLYKIGDHVESFIISDAVCPCVQSILELYCHLKLTSTTNNIVFNKRENQFLYALVLGNGGDFAESRWYFGRC